MKSRLSILMIFAVILSYCGTESAKNSLEQRASGQALPGPSTATSLGLEARLGGRDAQPEAPSSGGAPRTEELVEAPSPGGAPQTEAPEEAPDETYRALIDFFKP